ncbi:MAG TPA: hypothetical protein VGH54_16795 [Mycobacterium sp.]|uniref:hypothetical protein n=1 Tax=Mycobacterium sp. TaxID=1785 RepID=UPI002F4226A4
MRKSWAPELPAPAHYPGVVLEVHDNDRADILLFSGQQPVTLPNIPHLPWMELKHGYQVVVSTFGHECCVTAVIGFMTDEQIAGTYKLADEETS